jgi:hypothetical protein
MKVRRLTEYRGLMCKPHYTDLQYDLDDPDTPLPQCALPFSSYVRQIEDYFEDDLSYTAARLALAQRVELNGIDHQALTVLQGDELDPQSEEAEWDISRDYDSVIGYSSSLPYTSSIGLTLSGSSVGSLCTSVHIKRKVN